MEFVSWWCLITLGTSGYLGNLVRQSLRLLRSGVLNEEKIKMLKKKIAPTSAATLFYLVIALLYGFGVSLTFMLKVLMIAGAAVIFLEKKLLSTADVKDKKSSF